MKLCLRSKGEVKIGIRLELHLKAVFSTTDQSVESNEARQETETYLRSSLLISELGIGFPSSRISDYQLCF